MEKIQATGEAPDEAAGGEPGRVLGKAAGRRLTRATRDDLRRLADAARDGGGAAVAVETAMVGRTYNGLGPVWELDFDLLDAALDAGVPLADPPPEVACNLRAWTARARRGGLAVVAADPRFRPLLRDALLDRRCDLLALGRPDTALRDEPGLVDAILAAPGLVDILGDEVAAWAGAVAAGSLPLWHEAVHYLDLVGPARLAAACPRAGDAIAGLVGADAAELLAESWRTGLVDELGLDALDAQPVFSHGLDAFRIEPEAGAPEDSFVVSDGKRSVVFGPRGVVAGPLFARLERGDGSARTTHRFRYAHGTFTPVPASAVGAEDDAPEVTMPSATRPTALRRGAYGWWEAHNARGAVVARWYQGPARPARVTGTHTVGRRRHRWAAGSDLVPPPQVWPHLTPRDAAGSRLLRTADRALAQRVLDAVGDELARHITELGRRIPVCDGSHEVDEAFTALRDALARVLPEITAERLLDGVAGTVWSAAESRVLADRHVERQRPVRDVRGVGTGHPVGKGPFLGGGETESPEQAEIPTETPTGPRPEKAASHERADETEHTRQSADHPRRLPTLRTTPLPYPRADAGDLRARIFTDMQAMFLRLGRVAEAHADPAVTAPPQTVTLANALGWEGQVGRLGGRVLRASFTAAANPRAEDLQADHIRAWGVPHMGDPAGRWRTLSLRVDPGTAPPEGTVCRTARGCLIMLQGSSGSAGRPALEYAADGVFVEPPFGTVVEQRVCRGWGGLDRIAAWLRLRDERGPAPWPSASIEAFADAADLSVERATLLTFGFEARDAYMIRRGGTGLSGALRAASGLQESRVADAGARLARSATIEERLEIPELLMPDDPADLWADRLAVDRAAAWWNARRGGS